MLDPEDARARGDGNRANANLDLDLDSETEEGAWSSELHDVEIECSPNTQAHYFF